MLNSTNHHDKFILKIIWQVLFMSIAFQSYAALSALSVVHELDSTRGICVVLGKSTADLVIDLAQSSELTIFVQSTSDKDVLRTRKKLDEAGLLNTRVYVEQGTTSQIHLAANLADIVVLKDKAQFKQVELLRVLRPGGKLLAGKKISVKPVPDGIDQWTHPYHGPDNNPQSTDQIARAPFITQFLAQPYYGPMPAVTVTSDGKLFKAFGHIAFKKREWGMLSKLVAMNAYNGVILWERELAPGFMIHRNTMIATPDTLYLADNESCKMIDVDTGEIKDEITIPKDITDLYGWKWMAMVDGVLYALVGEPDITDEVLHGTKKTAGWPWTGLGENYDKFSEDYPWGFGRTLLAIDPATKQILWRHTEEQVIDSRALVLRGDRLYAYSHQNFLAAFDIKNGAEIWRTSDADLMAAIGLHDKAQTWQKGYSSQTYLSASDQALYFAGPQRTKIVAVSTEDGKMLWNYPDGNMLLVLRDNIVYAMGRLSDSKKLNPLTGEILADLPSLRGNCTRVNGTVDSIFARGDQHGGTLRLDVNNDQASRLPAMRPACQDGVIAANGLLYWGPWMCDCNHSLVGVISMCPAADFNYSQSAVEKERLETYTSNLTRVRELTQTITDWPVYRKNNQCVSQTAVAVGESLKPQWEFIPRQGVRRTAPVAVDGLTFVSGSDGIVYAIDNQNGEQLWSSYTGGRVNYPPAFWQDRLYVGSADGFVYAMEAATGKQLWRFRAAPFERKIPVYGDLSSTWPVTSLMVDKGVVYAAAGIASHDGTHVYALDAVTGEILWQNNDSGNLIGQSKSSGVSVQGHMLMHDNKVYMAGGNVVSPAVYDKTTGQCLNTLTDEWQKAPRGKELFLINGKVTVFDQMLYSPREYIPSRYYAKYLLHAGSNSDIVYQGTENEIMCIQLGAGPDGKAKRIWQRSGFVETSGVVVAQDAIITIGGLISENNESVVRNMLIAFNRTNGDTVFSAELPASPTSWGIAVDRDGRIIVTTDQGHVLCYQGDK